MARRVSRIAVTPVQGFALLHPERVEVGPAGVVENRRFFLVDGNGARLRSSLTAWPALVRGEYDSAGERLAMRFPDGTEVEGDALMAGADLSLDVHGRLVEGRFLDGPWTEPLSQLAGHPVRVVRTRAPGDYQNEPLTLLSEASLARLEREAGRALDPRRFRMLFVLAGCAEHEEDTWEGRLLRLGEAVLRVGGPVARCAVTTRDPDTGVRDFDTLAVLAGYRPRMDGGGIPFGVYATAEETGPVRLGDVVEPAG